MLSSQRQRQRAERNHSGPCGCSSGQPSCSYRGGRACLRSRIAGLFQRRRGRAFKGLEGHAPGGMQTAAPQSVAAGVAPSNEVGGGDSIDFQNLN